MKKIIASIIVLMIIGCVADIAWGQSIQKRIENKTIELDLNKDAIVQIKDAKVQLHNAANSLRKDYTYDASLISILGLKWNELNVNEQELSIQITRLESEIVKLKQQQKKTVESSENKTFLGTFEATAYCITGKTASGTHTTANRTMAVDPKVIPLGSKVYIEGYGTYIAEDTGGAVKGNIVDIYIPGYENCINFGRRKVKVYLIH